MLHLVCLLVVFLSVSFGFELPKALKHPIVSNKANFQLWKKTFNIEYKSLKENTLRFTNWVKTVEKITKHNDDKSQTWQMGLNKFSAQTWQEFKKTTLMEGQDCSATHGMEENKPTKHLKNLGRTPRTRDWRDEKIISEVKDQARCGSCWTFSTTGCLEAHHALTYGQLVLLSEQNLVDCAGNFDNDGCDGGLPSHAFEYIRYNGGINTEFSYPYTGSDGECSYSSATGTVGAMVEDVYNVTKYDETELYENVGNVGPVSIAYQVASDFQNYAGGVYTSTICGNTTQDVNHAVLAVGYNTDSGDSNLPYWIVKNSWGWGWGLDGYFYIERGVNMCGLASCASYPILPDPN